MPRAKKETTAPRVEVPVPANSTSCPCYLVISAAYREGFEAARQSILRQLNHDEGVLMGMNRAIELLHGLDNQENGVGASVNAEGRDTKLAKTGYTDKF